jgi:hypothetical protein
MTDFKDTLQSCSRDLHLREGSMPKRLPEEMRETELLPLCLAAKLADAKKIESVLDGEDIEYTFELTPLTHGSQNLITGGIRYNVMFFVPARQHQFCCGLLSSAGLSSLVVE